MSVITRITTWTSQLLTSASLNGEFNNIVNVLNNLDNATSSWTTVKTTTLTPTTVNANISFDNASSHGIVGTTTNNSAAAGNVGEYIESVVGPVNLGLNNVFGDLTSISLTAGDWDVTGIGRLAAGNSTAGTFYLGISPNSGNSATGLVSGSNYLDNLTAIAGVVISATVSSYRVLISTTTVYYLKFAASYSGSTPTAYGRLSARRIR